MSGKNCVEKTHFSPAAKTHLLYLVDKHRIAQINHLWPSENVSHKLATRKLLNKINKKRPLSKDQLVDLFKLHDKHLYRTWSNQEYNFVFDMLELPLIINQKRVIEQVITQNNRVAASSEIIDEIVAKIKTTNSRRLHLVTASSRDPYESADFYNGLFDAYDIDAAWLPLTPALSKAITKNDCDNLDKYRNEINQVYNREAVYPDLTSQERALCNGGVSNLIAQLKNSDAIFFNGGDQSLTKQIFVDAQSHQSYPWTDVIRTRHILIGTSAGTAVQSGGQNEHGLVPMITNGSSVNALKNGAFSESAPAQNCHNHGGCSKLDYDALTFEELGGLGTFDIGILDTHFSERGRTVRLAVLLAHSNQQFGFGVDETTVLKFDSQTQYMKVIGKQGVVVIEFKNSHFRYHFIPSGYSFALNDLATSSNEFVVETRGHDIIENGISDAVIREKLQAMCANKLAKVTLKEGSSPELSVVFKRDNKTRCERQADGRYLIKNMHLALANR